AHERTAHGDIGLRLDVVRQLLERNPGADERNERGRADVEPALARGDVVAHLVQEQQCDEARRVGQAPDAGVKHEREHHRACSEGELAPLEARQQHEEELDHGLALFGPAPYAAGLRRKNFITPAPSASAPTAITLANLSTKAKISANSPSFLAA